MLIVRFFFVIGFSEMFGVFIGMYLILYTRRRWLWTGLFSITAGVMAYLTWFIPDNCNLLILVHAYIYS